MKRFAARLRQSISRKKTVADVPNAGKEIEVFDVLIKTKNYLEVFHLKSGSNLLTNPSLSNYMPRMHSKFHSAPTDEDSVYILDVDKSLYDVSEPGFTQVHCLRFEYERSQGSFKITDIDFFLEGNRHARGISEEILSSGKSIK